MIKDLLIPTTATAGDGDAIAAGIVLAGAFEARLTVLELVSLPVPAANPWSLSPDPGMSDVYSRLRAQGEINVGRLRSRLDKESIASEVRLVEAAFHEPARVAAHHAHYADLAIMAGAGGQTLERDTILGWFATMLLESGRPVLVVPAGYKATVLPRRVVLAWRPTREAARALHDALPFLQRADQVDIVVINAVAGELGHGDEPGADVATHLARHGIEANVVRRDAGPHSVGTVLLEHARESAAQMIVAGGYGHSRLREWAMGGATRDLLLAAPIPVLFSH